MWKTSGHVNPVCSVFTQLYLSDMWCVFSQLNETGNCTGVAQGAVHLKSLNAQVVVEVAPFLQISGEGVLTRGRKRGRERWKWFAFQLLVKGSELDARERGGGEECSFFKGEMWAWKTKRPTTAGCWAELHWTATLKGFEPEPAPWACLRILRDQAERRGALMREKLKKMEDCKGGATMKRGARRREQDPGEG